MPAKAAHNSEPLRSKSFPYYRSKLASFVSLLMARKAAKKAAKKATKKAVKKSTKKKAKKPKKAKKTKKRKAKRVSTIAKGRMAKSQVLKGRKAKTVGGLKASDLKKNKHGKVVSKKQSAAAMKKLGGWLAAVAKARKALGCKGFVAIKKGSALYNKAKGFYGAGSPKK